ncbi:MAG TPA: hypothetical protein VFL88_08230 [Gemmatimonadales bacterium]|nr:hypothetical protein [Gemmatimonadales bacterium]
MCHFLYIASPLTLSEVRSMLPPGLAADFLPPAASSALRAPLPAAQTTARLLVGACSCDLYLHRDALHHREEAVLRQRYRALHLNRTTIIQAIDRHRRGDHPARDPAAWQALLSAFVIEHARNAGDTLYYREFSPGGLDGTALSRPPAKISVGAARSDPAGWLEEEVATVVGRG